MLPNRSFRAASTSLERGVAAGRIVEGQGGDLAGQFVDNQRFSLGAAPVSRNAQLLAGAV